MSGLILFRKKKTSKFSLCTKFELSILAFRYYLVDLEDLEALELLYLWTLCLPFLLCHLWARKA